jgi:hypothetical protein
MNVVERNAWKAFKNVICLEITKMDYKNIVRIMLENFHILSEFESAFPIFALKSFS